MIVMKLGKSEEWCYFIWELEKKDERITDGSMYCPYDNKQIWIVAYTLKAFKKLKIRTCSAIRCPECKKYIALEFQKGEKWWMD